jgi:hypothetical protein
MIRRPVRTTLLVLLALFFAFVLFDSLGVFDSRPYFEVPHGNHTHYVPKDCDPPLDPSNATTIRPGPDEKVDCTGRIVPR